MSTRRALLLVAVLAAANGAFFMFYQAPDWATVADQDGYRRLGRALAETGRFTRFPESPTFVPEVIRTPGYPIVVALVYTLFGTSQEAIALAQTALFIAMTLIVFAIARACAPPRVAVAAAALTACYPTFGYYAALVMTELWTTVVLTASIAAAFLAQRTGRLHHQILAGFLFGYTALSRPAFVLLPIALAGMGTVLCWPPFARRLLPRSAPTGDGRGALHFARDVVRPWSVILAVFALTLLPWFLFNASVMDRFALAPAGGVGRGLWEGSWQGYWAGRFHDQLTQLAAEPIDTAALDARILVLATETGHDPRPMQTYTHQWREIRRIWDEPTDPRERADARIAADNEYRRVALENIAADPIGHIRRRLTRGLFVLWNADIWLRYSQINAAPPLVIRAMWAIQAGLAALAIWGAVVLLRQRRLVEAWLLITPLLYVTAVHVPLLTEARQSLPVKPLLLIAAVIGGTDLAARARGR